MNDETDSNVSDRLRDMEERLAKSEAMAFALYGVTLALCRSVANKDVLRQVLSDERNRLFDKIAQTEGSEAAHLQTFDTVWATVFDRFGLKPR